MSEEGTLLVYTRHHKDYTTNPRFSLSGSLLRRTFVFSHIWTSKSLLVKSFNTSLHLYIWTLTQALEDVI
jgi:hypothetical protein